jgi:uncharacterized protein YjbI with pentapeptide repeats
MEILNRTPFRFGSLVGQIPFPGHSLPLLVKGTFELNPGAPATPAGEQLFPTGDEYDPEDEERQGSLRYSSDFVFLKEKADVLLVGRCIPPGGRPAPRCTVAFQVGDLRHTLQVSGDRCWAVRGDRWVPTDPKPFAEMSLRYERAFGGEGFGPNPAGKGLVDVLAANGRMVRPLPNIEVPESLVTSPDDRPPPAGFGPLDPGWEPRREKLGAYGGDYLRKRWPWFAEDMDRGQFNAAPPSMQLQGYLRGDEGLLFENLHPAHPVFQSALPGLRVRCFTNKQDPNSGGKFTEIDMRLDTLWVDMEAERLVLVWRGWTPVASSEYDEVGHVYIVSEPMTEAPESVEHHKEAFAERIAAQASGRGPGGAAVAAGQTPEGGRDPGSVAAEDGATADGSLGAEATGAGSDVQMGREAGMGSASAASAAGGAAGALDPDIKRAIDEARPHLRRLGIDPAELEGGDPEVVVPKLLEKLKAELRAQGIDLDKAPALTPEQKQHQAEIMADLGIPWNAATGLPELEGFELENPESMIDREMEKLKSQLPAGGVEVDKHREPTPEQKAELARLGIDFDAIKEGLGPTSEVGDGGESGGGDRMEAEPTPDSVRDSVEKGESLAGTNLEGIELAGSILPGAILSGSILAGASFATGADLTGADLTEATLDGASGEGAVFEEAILEKCSVTGALLRGASLKKVRGRGACFDRADLTGADLEGAKLFKASFRDTRLGGAHAPDAILAQCDVTGLRASGGADLTGASFFRAHGSKPMWMDSDLSGADFRWARLEAADFTGADLTGARMHAADLPRTRFRKATLAGATLTRVNLFEGSFERANLTGADLRSSNLFAVEFLDATLEGADMENANLKRTKLVLEGWEQ